MPQDLTIGVFILGAILLIIGLVGGGFKLFGAEIPSGVSGRNRMVACILGCMLIGGSLWGHFFRPTSTPPTQPTAKKEPPPTPSGPATPVTPQPASDFPGGTRRVYSADFSTWTRYDSQYGSIKLGFANSYVMEPSGTRWLFPSSPTEIPPLEGDFVFDLRFHIEEGQPSLGFSLTGGGTDAELVNVNFNVRKEGNVVYSLEKQRVRSGGGLAGPNVIPEESIADREQLPSALKVHDWSKGSKLTLKREGGRMQFFVNDLFVKEFGVSRFPVMKISIAAAGKSKVIITSIEGRVKE